MLLVGALYILSPFSFALRACLELGFWGLVLGDEAGALGHVERRQDELSAHLVYILHCEYFCNGAILLRLLSLRHEVGDAEAQLILYDFVSQAQLLFQMSNVAVSLFYMEICPVLLPLKVDVLQIKQVLLLH